MSKEDNVDYRRLDQFLESHEPLQVLRTAVIAPARLRALKRLASSDSDRKLLELAAVDGYSGRQAGAATGTNWRNETSLQRTRREEKMAAALATFEACQQLSALQSLADISARLGRQISEDDVTKEMARLVEIEQRLDAMELSEKGLGDCLEADLDLDLPVLLPAEAEADLDLDLDGVDTDRVDALREALGASLDGTPLDSLQLAPQPTDVFAEVFGDGWQQDVGASLEWETREAPEEEPALPDQPDQPDLLDEAEELALQVQAELQVADGLDPYANGEDEEEGELYTLLSGLDAKQLVAKLVAVRRRQQTRVARQSKAFEEAHRALAGERGRSARLDTVLKRYPDIGDKIELICADLGVGADAGRRDGSITLNRVAPTHGQQDGSKHVGFRRIKIELERRFGYVVSTAAVIELGIARNKRHTSAARYKGVVSLRMRRSVKRVSEEHLDTRAQRAAFRTGHFIRDRCSQHVVCHFERDDHSMIRMDSSATTNQHATATVGEGAGAPQHDYMNSDVASSIYATTIRGPAMSDGCEVNIAVVKLAKLSPSNPTQHFADLYMLQESQSPEVRRLYRTPEGGYKPVLQMEVDSGSDECLRGVETRFLAAEAAMGGPLKKKEMIRAQVGTVARAAADTALNVVERVNGCETQAAATFFAGTDACGDLHDPATGQLDLSRVHAMWAHHLERYRVCLDGASGLNNASIVAVLGASASSCDEAKILLERRPVLIELLSHSTSNKRRAELKAAHKELAQHVAEVQAYQEHAERLTHYALNTRTCPNVQCKHTCASAPRIDFWYPGGPPLKPYPLPYLDPKRKGQRMQPEDALAKYAVDKYQLPAAKNDLLPPSRHALEQFEKHTKPAPLARFPEAKLQACVDAIGDSSVTPDVLRAHFLKLHYIRLRRLEGCRKAAATKGKKKAARAAAATEQQAAIQAATRAALHASKAKAPPAQPPQPPQQGRKRQRAAVVTEDDDGEEEVAADKAKSDEAESSEDSSDDEAEADNGAGVVQVLAPPHQTMRHSCPCRAATHQHSASLRGRTS